MKQFTEPHGGKNFNSVVWSDEIDQIQPKIDEIWGSKGLEVVNISEKKIERDMWFTFSLIEKKNIS